MIIQRLLDYLNVLNSFSEVVKILHSLPGFEIFIYDYSKTPGCLKILNNFSEVLGALQSLLSFKIVLYDYSKNPGLLEDSE